jgi:hypothetical protein
VPPSERHVHVAIDMGIPCTRRWVWRWGKRYDPATDAERKALEMESHARQQAKRAEHVFNMADHPTGNVAPLNVD